MTTVNLSKELQDITSWTKKSQNLNPNDFSYDEMIDLLDDIEEYSFQKKSDVVQKIVYNMNADQLQDYLSKCGVIPERFSHDSSNEKIYAELCEIIVASFFKQLGETASVLEKRSGSADVLASQNQEHVVLDAKAFRLSRTALNPKDYKIEAINEWKDDHDAKYSGLVGPLNQFPGSRSRLYSEAARYNVTLLSYGHLGYILKHRSDVNSLEPLWTLGDNLMENYDVDEINGDVYWDKVEDSMTNIVGDIQLFNTAIKENMKGLEDQSQQQIEFWESKKDALRDLEKEELVQELIKAKKINKKVDRIENKDHSLY
jgi:hypothetical protein